MPMSDVTYHTASGLAMSVFQALTQPFHSQDKMIRPDPAVTAPPCIKEVTGDSVVKVFVFFRL